MSDTLASLFDIEPDYRVSDPETSREAARVAAVTAGSDRHKVLAAHAAHPEGLTDFELQEVTGIKQTSGGKRRGELVTAHCIERAPLHPRKGKLNPTCASIVWRITDRGREVLAELREGQA